MSEEQKDVAAEHARRAGRQAKNAAKNGIKAAQAAAKPALEAVTDEVQDTAQKTEATVEDAVRSVKASNVRLALATTAVFLGGTYLVGCIAGYRRARKMAVEDIMDATVKSETSVS